MRRFVHPHTGVAILDIIDSMQDEFKLDQSHWKYSDERREMDSLQWWKANQSMFPTLARAARNYLSVPATSTSSERVWSKADGIITADRTCMPP